jgi:PEP-CTERM motif-containing protein
VCSHSSPEEIRGFFVPPILLVGDEVTSLKLHSGFRSPPAILQSESRDLDSYDPEKCRRRREESQTSPRLPPAAFRFRFTKSESRDLDSYDPQNCRRRREETQTSLRVRTPWHLPSAFRFRFTKSESRDLDSYIPENCRRRREESQTSLRIPEPTTFALPGLGAAGLLIFRRRKN